jgi:hypothetical protein
MSTPADRIQEIARLVNLYSSGVIVPIGLALNLATVAIFSRKNMRSKTNMSLLYIVLAIFDIFALFNSLIFVQFLPAIGFNIGNLSDLACKLRFVWIRIIIQLPSWQLILITCERFRLVCFPNKHNFLDKKKYLFVSIATIIITIALINSVHFTFTLVKTTRTINESTNGTIFLRQMLTYSCTASSTIIFIVELIVVFNRSYIPFIVMLILNIIMTKKFLESRRKLKSKSNSSTAKRENYFTFTVITMNITFFVLYTPWSLWYVVNRTYQINQTWINPVVTASLNLSQNICLSIAYINNLSSFFNNLIFNKLFKNELMLIFNLKKYQAIIIDNKSLTALNDQYNAEKTRKHANANIKVTKV